MFLFNFFPTWVCVMPRVAATSALSGKDIYCVLWKRRSNIWSCSDEYIDLGFLIFLPFPLTRVISSPFSTVKGRSGSPKYGSKAMVRIRLKHIMDLHLLIWFGQFSDLFVGEPEQVVVRNGKLITLVIEEVNKMWKARQHRQSLWNFKIQITLVYVKKKSPKIKSVFEPSSARSELLLFFSYLSLCDAKTGCQFCSFWQGQILCPLKASLQLLNL